MHQSRLPASAVIAGSDSPSASESPSGLWPLGAIDRASLLVGRLEPFPSSASNVSPILDTAEVSAISQQVGALQDPVAFWVNLFASAPIGFAVWKSDGRVMIANNALRSIFGSTPPADYNVFDDKVATDLGVVAAIRRAFTGETISLPTFWYDPRECKNATVSEGRRIAVSASMFPITNASGAVEYVAAVYRDDTNTTLAQQQLKAQSEQLERHIIGRTAELEEANEELEAFSYSVSHDLRAPLRAIDAFATLLADDGETKLGTTGHDCLRRIRAASQRMSDLINDLLSFSRLGRQSLEVKNVATGLLVEEVLEELMMYARGREIEIRIEPLPQCRADLNLLREVFMNLLDNAIKFTRKNAAPRIDVGTRVQDGQLVWHVKDNGVGFDMAHYERLFNVFSRLHTVEEFEGTGVGLALVNRIIKRHNGEIWAYAEPGKGATFYFTLAE